MEPSPNPNLRVLDDSSVARELDLATEVFHRINRIIPQDQTLLTIAPTRTVREAVRLMRQHGYSQLPVVADGGEVLGVFSFRSFAKEAAASTLADWAKQKCAPGDLQVDEFLEQFEFRRVTEEMSSVFDALDRDNAVVIGSPEHPIGILTPMDFLRYLYQVASPFVLVLEIELALRALIRVALDEGQVAAAARRCLTSAYGGEDRVPTRLEEMSFDNYNSIIAHGDHWPLLGSVFGTNRARTSARLKELAELRNVLFHFKRPVSLQDHETLSAHRNWFLGKLKQAEGRRARRVTP